MILAGYLKPGCEKFALCWTTRVWTLSKARKKMRFSMLLEGNLREGWDGIRMVILVLDSLIFWDHYYPSNQFILSYILSEFSWKRLSKKEANKIKQDSLENWWKIVWRTKTTTTRKLQQVYQRWLIFFMQVRKCVCQSQGPLKGSLRHQGSSCNIYFPSIWYNNMSLSHKANSILLYNSLIIYID